MKAMIKVKKRNGSIVEFNSQKIINAVNKALKTAKVNINSSIGTQIADIIIKSGKEVISIEEIHDNVETGLMERGLHEAAKSYILYRHNKKQKLIKEKEEKKQLLNIEGQLDPVSEKFSLNSLRVLESRYLLKDKELKPIETPTQLFERIATHVGSAVILYDERLFDKEAKQDNTTMTFTTDSSGLYWKELNIGKYKLNEFTIDQLFRLYSKLHKEKKMKIHSFNQVLDMIEAGEFDKHEKTIKAYFDIMVSQKFMPNTPTIANSGTKLGQLSACFVLPMADNIEAIMDTAKNMAVIFKSGGGVGINYADLREEGALISSTSGTSSGPLSFMNIINTVTDTVKQGGKRRGANMGIMNSSHPNILKFIHAKETPGVLENFNVSVGADERFFQALKDNQPYELVSPHTHEVKSRLNPRDLFKDIAQSAWKSAEPGMIFFDNVNRYNVMWPLKGELNSTNPCGEQTLYPYESCNLGSINLTKFVKNGIFDWEEFGKVVETTTDFLDNVIDMNKYPIPEIDNESWNTRRIGLGIMGLADALYMLEIPYNSEKSFKLQEQIAQFLTYKSIERSIKLARLRGSFPYFQKTAIKEGLLDVSGVYENSLTNIVMLDWNELASDIVEHGLRNVNVTTVAPTGSISMIADCSSGVEPVFALAFEKKVAVGNFYYVNTHLESYLKKHNIDYDEELLKEIAKSGSCQTVDLPDDVKNIFVTSMDIHWVDHVFAQAVWQRWITNSISKTINMPNNATSDDVKNAYFFAHEIGCKGITVYRDGSRHTQVLYTNDMENKVLIPSSYTSNVYEEITGNEMIAQIQISTHQSTANTIPDPIIQMIKSGDKTVCPNCEGPTAMIEGCASCVKCGVSFC